MKGHKMKPYAECFYKSKAWQDCRDNYLKSVGGLCEICLSNGIYNVGEIVHHKKPITPTNINDPAITLNHDNLQLLCREHHAAMHTNNQRRYTIDDKGNVLVSGVGY